MTTRIGVGVVTFGAPSSLPGRLELALSAGYPVYVFDNSPAIPEIQIACELMEIHYITEGRNSGLGIGISSLCKAAAADGLDALLFFDQDTVFDQSTLDFVAEFYRVHPDIAATHAVVGFNARAGNDHVAAASAVVKDVLLTISSGSLFYLPNARRMGWHNRTYFVDAVDYEFCLNAARHGFKIGEVSTTPGFDHVSEQADETLVMLGRRIRLRCYPWSRVKDSAVAGVRVLITAVISGQGRYVVRLGRLLAGYLFWTVISRTIPMGAPASPDPE